MLEGGLDSRYLPADCGVGRPGLEGRIAEAQKDWFWSTVRPSELQARPGAPTGWNDKLLAAGLRDVEVHSFVLEVPPPFPRAYVRPSGTASSSGSDDLVIFWIGKTTRRSRC